jgi:predicted DCC family thiol-disulfide oxidoreductase YuxK
MAFRGVAVEDGAVPALPTLLFDRDCGFCKLWIERWRRVLGERVAFQPLQEWTESSPAREELTRAIHLVFPDGQTFRAAAAVFCALSLDPDRVWLWWLYRLLPPFAWVSQAVYGWVSTHRVGAARLARLAWGDEVPASYALSRSVFLRVLAAIYAIAFVSFWVQADGLVGSHGIWPVGEFMRLVHQNLGANAWREMPSLFLLSSSDATLHAVCAAGAALAIALAVGVWPRGSLFCLWALYLSVEHAGYIFLGYQWDLLLLEVGLLAIPFAPAGFWPRRGARPPSTVSLWLLRWLLFRLMFMSGAVKLLSNDETWRNLTALQFHYWSQPLPDPVSVWANDLPPSFQTFSCAAMFAIELGAPFLIFGVRRMRQGACAAIAFLQIVILATGNYGFFNWLTLALCVPLLDDAVWTRLIPARFRSLPAPARRRWTGERWVRRAGLPALALVYLAASTGEMVARLGRHRGWKAPFIDLVETLEPLRSVNGYGLFAVMTTDRPEIIVEGSADGQTWRPYEFKWKPGRLDRPPRLVAPHQPRLDWQMWFAALGSCRHNPWFLQFQKRLLEGSAEVLALMDGNPFSGEPPKYLRSTMYQYRFASREERRQGIWWTRTEEGPYCPELALVDGELSTVR